MNMILAALKFVGLYIDINILALYFMYACLLLK